VVTSQTQTNLTPWGGVAFGTLVIVVAAGVMAPFRSSIGQVAATAVFLLTVTIVASLSTRWAALWAFVISGAVLNVVFMTPYGSLKISHTEDVVGFVAYSVVCATSVLIIHAWKTSRDSTRSATTLAREASERAARGEERLTWLSHVSHDIRTPLSTIRAVVEDMRAGVEYEASTRDELLSVAVDEVDRLDRLVGNWLVLGSIDAHESRDNFVAIDLGEVVADAVRRLGPLMRSHTVESNIAPTIDPIDGDFVELRHLAMNLLTNAQRYTPPGSVIRVSVSSDANGVTLVVSDNGPGFEPDKIHALTKPFVAGAMSRSSGLGLSICTEVVRHHNGTIALSNDVAGGAVVTVAFPHRNISRTGGVPRS
jgi:K+-sensing histidine kinase KdpD